MYAQYAPQYAPPSYPPNDYPAPSGYPPNDYPSDSKSPYEGGRFAPKKRLNDPIFLLLYVITVLGFAVVSVIVLIAWVKHGGLGGSVGGDQNHTGTKISLNSHTAILLLFVAAAGLVLASLYLILTRMFTKAILHITLILSILLNIGVAVLYWIEKVWVAAIIFTVIAIISVLAYFGYRARIPLATVLLQTVMDISKHHPSVYVVAFVALLVQSAVSVWFAFTAIATYERWTPGNPACTDAKDCSSGKVTGLVIFEVFAYIWMSQVIGNVALSTMAGGPFGSWYYFGPREQGQMPSHPTLSAFVRSSTLSLGSIAFGSLIVTILELIRLVLEIAKDNANSDGHPVEACLALCAECFIGCIEGMVEYFNRYAYIEIALYGKPYLAAAKDTWGLFKDRGIDTVINDSLVSMALTWGGYVVGLLCALFAFLYLHFTHPSYNSDGQYTVPVLVFAFLIGLQCSLTLSSAIEAGVSTIFVGLGEDPQVLAIRAPELFGLIASTYPQVVQGVARV
ncbi:plasma-membrane choline transporter-domain-containing protein [Irpex lacteus]|nr:plasma-membrane choline transporter-domain-containing protein [Irpex lacteus]